jgi:peptidoglycan/LPS O-acetylase OafA/YrhL
MCLQNPPHNDQIRIGGLDALRVTAMLLVLLFHQLHVWSQEEWAGVQGLDMGQAGVSIFLAISGVLASNATRSPSTWLVARLSRVFPPYWVALILSFCLTAAFNYKTFDAHQVLMQMAGLGMFIRPDALVNVATWFVSLLLLCYATVFLARLSRFPIIVMVILAISSMFLIFRGFSPQLANHGLTFFASYVIFGVSGDHKREVLAIAAVAFMFFCWIDIRFAYTVASLLLVAISLGVSETPKTIAFLSSISYEYYLLHAIFVVGAHHFLGSYPAPAIILSTVSTIGAAWILQQFVSSLWRLRGRSNTAGLG